MQTVGYGDTVETLPSCSQALSSARKTLQFTYSEYTSRTSEEFYWHNEELSILCCFNNSKLFIYNSDNVVAKYL